MEYKPLFAGISIFIAIISYLPYIKDVLQNKTKPHAFTWLVWAVLTVVGLMAQIEGKAGSVVWVSVFTLIVCLFILGLALLKGRKNIVRADWISLVGAGTALGLWLFTKNGVLSILLAVCVDIFALVPTLRKSYMRPHEETISAFVMSALKYIFAIFTLDHYSILTVLYPVGYSIVFNTLFVTMLVVRRKQLGYKI
jgi:hypothetical protein